MKNHCDLKVDETKMRLDEERNTYMYECIESEIEYHAFCRALMAFFHETVIIADRTNRNGLISYYFSKVSLLPCVTCTPTRYFLIISYKQATLLPTYINKWEKYSQGHTHLNITSPSKNKLDCIN